MFLPGGSIQGVYPRGLSMSRGLCPWSHVPSSGVSIWGSLYPRSGPCLGGLCSGCLCRQTRRHNQKSGRYASYWNAFLYCCCTAKTYVDFLQVFRLEMTQWLNEVLLDVIFQCIFDIRHLFVGFARFDQSLPWNFTQYTLEFITSIQQQHVLQPNRILLTLFNLSSYIKYSSLVNYIFLNLTKEGVCTQISTIFNHTLSEHSLGLRIQRTFRLSSDLWQTHDGRQLCPGCYN